jgi:hypothetical protein
LRVAAAAAFAAAVAVAAAAAFAAAVAFAAAAVAAAMALWPCGSMVAAACALLSAPRRQRIEAAIREQAQDVVLGLGMECSGRAPRCVDARRVMRRACKHGARIVRVRTIRLIAQG